MPSRIAPMEPARSPSGYWTHPDYFVPAGDRHDEAPGEFNAWLVRHGVRYAVSWLENEMPPGVRRGWNVSRDNISAWQPVPPPGKGWFIVSLHDTPQGAACIWLCHEENADDATAA